MPPHVLTLLAALAVETRVQDAPLTLAVDEPRVGVIADGDAVIETETLVTQFTDAPTVGKTFRVEVNEEGSYTIELRSWHFDAYLVLRDAQGGVLAEDDDGLLSTHSRLVTSELTRGETYFLQACALHGERGPFELVLRPGAPRVPSPQERGAEEIADLERRAAVIEERDGPATDALADTLNTLGIALYRQGRYSEAIGALERALSITERNSGPEHPDTAARLNNLAVLLKAQGELAAARPLYERALSIRERSLGPEHPDTAQSLGNLGILLRAQGDLVAARPYYERALSIWEEVRGPEHPETAKGLGNLGFLLKELGELAAARPYYERALSITEKVLGPEHPDTARSLTNLGVLLKAQGDLAAARPYFERALSIHERVLGPEHPTTAVSLGNLAVLLKAQGELAAARPLYERALSIRERVLGPEHLDTARSLNNLGVLLKEQGELAAARPLHERALSIWEKGLGPEHPRTAAGLSNLGSLLNAQGELAAARSYYERALSITEKVLGPEHPDTAMFLNNLAGVLDEQGELVAAQSYYERALSIRERVLGPEHPDTATSLNNLGFVLERRGDLEAARPLYERSLSITEEVLGPEHLDTAGSLGNLGVLLRSQGDLVAARPYYERALSITEKVLGPGHTHTAQTVSNLALLLTDLGELDRARDLILSSASGHRAHAQRMLGGLTEAESFQYLAKRHWELEIRLSLFVSEDPAILAEAYEGVLGWKGQIARTLIASREQLGRELTRAQRELVARLRAQQARLSRALSEDASPDQAERLALLSRERNELELELSRTLEGNRGEDGVSLPDVRAALTPRSAVLDFTTHRLYRPATWAGEELERQGSWTEEHVIAWIVRPESRGGEGNEEGRSPRLVRVDLGPAAELEATTHAFLEELVARRGAAPSEAQEPVAVRELRRLLWEPLADHLESVETLFVSPDSFLGTLPFETLELEDGGFLVEELGIVYLQDVSSLARRDAEAVGDYDSLLAIGGVDFRERADWEGAGVKERTEPIEATALDRGSFTDYWGRLPATEYEAQVVTDMHEDAFGDEGERTLLQGDEPSEERLKHELTRHSVLHLATHGFFQPEGTPSMWESALNERGMREMRMSEEAAYLVGKHPGLLSGLVCAGANRASEKGDDGYLTAEEVGWLDLSDCELVVMSACETGLGRAKSGEGLIGLRRAFRVAGAKTVISSLWSVKDESTAELMRDFYKNLFLKGMGRHEALRSAQLAMLQRNRMEHGEALPSTWGAFVLSGEWR